MTTHLLETISTTWDDARDSSFFRLTAELFSTQFTAGAGVLLASYDDESTVVVTATRCRQAATPLPATVAAV